MKHFLILLFILASILPAHAQQPATFIKGADVSALTEQEDRGETFQDTLGRPRECLSLLQDYGLQAVRLRVWVDPKRGYSGKEDVLRKALRAKALGMDIMLCFHYSDSWADPGKQRIPAAWEGHSFKQMKRDLSRHTTDVLRLLKQNGVEPRWVQVGNETSGGLLWPMGSIRENPEQYAGFIEAGYRAVKRVFKRAQVIVHLDNGFDQALYDYNLSTILRHGAHFDLIGMSLYPFWALDSGKEPTAEKTITDCMANIRHVWEKFSKDMIIVETGFETDEARPEIMLEGERQLRRIIREARSQTDGHCLGIFYWEPQLRPGHYRLNAFDSSGRPTAIMRGFLEH